MKKNYVSGYHPHKMAKFGTFPDSYKEALECLDITDGAAQFPGTTRKS